MPKDFEGSANWLARSNTGETLKEKFENFSGNFSLKIISQDSQNFIIKTTLPWQFQLLKDNLVVALWMVKNSDKDYDTKPLLAPVLELKEFSK